jgi:hypothetical protein
VHAVRKNGRYPSVLKKTDRREGEKKGNFFYFSRFILSNLVFFHVVRGEKERTRMEEREKKKREKKERREEKKGKKERDQE